MDAFEISVLAEDNRIGQTSLDLAGGGGHCQVEIRLILKMIKLKFVVFQTLSLPVPEFPWTRISKLSSS